MALLLLEFDSFPEEKAIVGEMLMAYGEIEFALVRLIGTFFQEDNDTAARILFRVKGEGPRLDVADAILRPARLYTLQRTHNRLCCEGVR